MPDMNDWLADASRYTARPLSTHVSDFIAQRIAHEPSPETFGWRRQRRDAMVSAACAAIIGFGASSVVGTAAFAKSAPTWVAAPSASSPYGLLIGQ